MAHPAVPYRATLFSPPYRRRRVLHLGFSCQVAGGGGVLNGKLVGDQAMSHVPFHWLQLFCGFAPLWYCFLSVKSHHNGQQLGLGVLFHLPWPPLAVFGVFLPFLIFKFPTASARRPPKIKFLILWAAANGVHRKFTGDIWYFSGISLAHLSTALKNRADEKP